MKAKLYLSILLISIGQLVKAQCPDWSGQITTSRIPLQINNPNYVWTTQQYSGSATSFVWELTPYPNEQYYIDNNLPMPSGTLFANDDIGAQVYPEVEGDYLINVYAVTACGNISINGAFNFLAVDSSTYTGDYYYLSYNNKNQTKGELKVCYENPNSFAKDNIFKATLFDMKGNEVTTTQNKRGENFALINTSEIPEGNYSLYILSGQKLIRKRITI